MAFDRDFVPTPDVPLSLHVRRHGPVQSVYGPIDCLPRITAYNLYNIHQVVHIDPATNPASDFVASPASEPFFDSKLEPEPDGNPEGHNQSCLSLRTYKTIPLLLGALAIAFAAVALRPLIPRLRCPYHETETLNQTALRPPPVCKSKQAVPLSLFDDLAALIRRRANAPLPLIVSAQDVVNQYYNNAHGSPPPHRTSNDSYSDSSFSAPITVFFVHLQDASTNLCNAATDWALVSKFPMLDDITFLCSAIFRSAINLPIQWSETTSLMAHSYSHTSVTAISTLLDTLGRHDSSIQHETDADSGTGAPCPLADPYFYNTTSYAVLNSLKQIFFGTHSPPDPGLARFSELVHDATRMTAALERELSDQHARLLLLSNMLIRRPKTRVLGCLDALNGVPARTKADYALADIATRYDNLLPLINTATTLVWIVGFTHQEFKNITRDLERLANQTLTLVAVPPPLPPTASPTPHDQCNQQPAWHATSWVLQTYGTNPEEGGIACTFWYLPPIGDIVMTFEMPLSWCEQEAGASEQDYEWLYGCARLSRRGSGRWDNPLLGRHDDDHFQLEAEGNLKLSVWT
ncbi:hypothetical protein ColTof4_01383 [Colletotrichum tofieldiae]|nr:hypothetical protein ColTof3_08637 [Colletotrichum tofieldiae]GKT68960.1 hypothetical protein ColTof4_01383 [Colletotrichum tofieldiae]